MPRPARKAVAAKSNPKRDIYHNRLDQPCCRLLQEIKDEIIKPNEQINLASAIRYYLQTEGAVSVAPISNQQQKKSNSEDSKMEETEENDAAEGNEAVPDLIESPSTDDVPHSEGAQLEDRTARRKRLLYNFLAKANQNASVSTRPRSSSLHSFVEYLTEKQVRCQIPPSALQQAVNEIVCESCRKSVQDHLSKNSMLILNFGGLEDEKADAHFDYVAMEEGLGQEKERWYFVRDDSSSSSQLWGSDSKEGEKGVWELLYSAANARSDGGDAEQIVSTPWTWEHFLFFVENGILLPALSIDCLLGFDHVDKILPKDSVKDILEKVYRLCGRRETAFCEWATQLMEAKTTFDEQTPMHGVGGNIEMSSFAIMKSTDETCQQVLRKLFEALWEVTQHTISVTGFSQLYSLDDSDLTDNATEEEKKWWPILRAQRQADHACSPVFAKLLDLWHDYSQAIENIASASATYEKKVEEQSNAQGNIPAMYCSANVRELYRRLVIAKYRTTYHLIARFQTHLDTEVNLLDPLLGKDAAWNVSWYRYLIAQTAYQDALGSHTRKKKRRNGSTLSFDEMLQTLVLAVAKWVMESIHQGTVQKLMMEHEQRRKCIHGMIQRLVETGERDLARDASDTIRAPGSRNSYSVVLLELNGLCDDLSNNEQIADINSVDRGDAILKTAAFRLKLWERCVVLMSNWLYCSVSLNLEGRSGEKHDYSWLALASTTELPFTLRKQLYLEQTGRFDETCLGGDGSFRVECMLLGLLYRWMDERYKEWQAVVAEQELLLTVSEEKLQAPPSAISGKKNKQKRATSKKAGPASQVSMSKITAEDAASTENGPSPEEANILSEKEFDDTGPTDARDQPGPGDLHNSQHARTADDVTREEMVCDMPEEKLTPPNAVLKKKEQKKKMANKKAATDVRDARPTDPKSKITADTDIAALEDHVGHLTALEQPELLHRNPETTNGGNGYKCESQPVSDNEPVEPVTVSLSSDNGASFAGVLDGDNFFTAEEYLVARLTKVLRFPVNTAFITS